MDIVQAYLDAVAAQLPVDTREDIVAELRDLILSRFEAKEEELGRALSDDEREAILREIGHPLVVAARYRKGPDSLVGPTLFPYWLFGVKAGLLVLLAVHGIGLVIRLVSGTSNFGQDISQAFHSFFGAGLTLIGAATLIAAIMEHQNIRPKWLTEWRVRDLGAFQMADPARWGLNIDGPAVRPEPRPRPMPWRPIPTSQTWPGGDHLVSAIAVTIFVLWWIGAIAFPGAGQFQLGGQSVTVAGAPIWATLFTPILLYALGQIAIDVFALARPDQPRMRALLQIAIAGVGLWLTWTVFEAGHWVTLSTAAEQARVEGGRALLDFDLLRDLGDGGRTLPSIAATLSVILTWVLAISGISLVAKVILNAWRAVQPGIAKGPGW